MPLPDQGIAAPTTRPEERIQQRLRQLETRNQRIQQVIASGIPGEPGPQGPTGPQGPAGSPGGGDYGTWFTGNWADYSPNSGFTADDLWYVEVKVLNAASLTGLVYVVDSGGTGNVRAALYNSSGTRVANRTSDATVPASGVHQVAFDTPYSASPGRYFAGLVWSSPSPSIYSAYALCPSGNVAGPGSTQTPTSITPATTPASEGVAVLSTY
jgi:hypothetical protein